MMYFFPFYILFVHFYALPKDYALVRSHGAIPNLIFELDFFFLGLELVHVLS